MARTEIDGEQIQDETVEGKDIKDGSVEYVDLDDTTVGDNLTKKVIVDDSLEIVSSTGIESGKGEVSIRDKSGRYGEDYSYKQKANDETTTGGTFSMYDTLTFNVSDSTSNSFELDADFFYGHNSASNDIRIRIQLDGTTVKEMRIEVKDAGTDQRYQNNLRYVVDDLAQGSHTLALEYRPATANRQSRMYESIITAKRVI